MSNSQSMDRILRLLADSRASDVYLSANAPAMIKIHGQTVPVNSQLLGPDEPLAMLQQLVNDKHLAQLAQTGELNTAVFVDTLGNFRLSAFHQRGKVAVVIRYVPAEVPSIESLNVAPVLADLVMERRGLVLMVGAAGSGKSTTLAAMIDRRNERASGHILTVEEPIEYVFKNKKSVVNQREVGSDTESLDVALKNALRQAPDVILIGEIRDQTTMSAAIAYAQSGHLVLATLHASNSYHALNRILSFYPVEVRPTLLGDLAAGLRAIVSQRLLRTPAGARIPAMEVMLNTALIADLIEKSDFSGVREAMEKSLAEGSQTFEQNIARLVTDGLVTRDEGLSHSDSPSNLMWRLQNDFTGGRSRKQDTTIEEDTGPIFTEFALDVRP
jgi:twitching motility protein PilU